MIPNTPRLRILANHLLNGDLGHLVFDLSVMNAQEEGNYLNTEIDFCGSHGDAIGELPICFPQQWKFRLGDEDNVFLKNNSSNSTTFEDVQDFFQLDENQLLDLFWTNRKKEWSSQILTSKSGKNEVANEIIKFCNWVENGTVDNKLARKRRDQKYYLNRLAKYAQNS